MGKRKFSCSVDCESEAQRGLENYDVTSRKRKRQENMPFGEAIIDADGLEQNAQVNDEFTEDNVLKLHLIMKQCG